MFPEKRFEMLLLELEGLFSKVFTKLAQRWLVRFPEAEETKIVSIWEWELVGAWGAPFKWCYKGHKRQEGRERGAIKRGRNSLKSLLQFSLCIFILGRNWKQWRTESSTRDETSAAAKRNWDSHQDGWTTCTRGQSCRMHDKALEYSGNLCPSTV